MPAGPFVDVSLTGASVTIGGVSASGSFSFLEGTLSDGTTAVTEIAFTDLQISLTPTAGSTTSRSASRAARARSS